MKLGINVDHVATLRQARGTPYPDPCDAAAIAVANGADLVTVHLREDRRHIQERDVLRIRDEVRCPLNLEMAATDEMLAFALKVKPDECCLVPEKREELTTEGGLNVSANIDVLKPFCTELASSDIAVSLFIDPDTEQIDAAQDIGAPIVELHTGRYAEARGSEQDREFHVLSEAVTHARDAKIQVNAGHGLHYENVAKIVTLKEIVCLNIGHAIVSRAVITGMAEAVTSMKVLLEPGG